MHEGFPPSSWNRLTARATWSDCCNNTSVAPSWGSRPNRPGLLTSFCCTYNDAPSQTEHSSSNDIVGLSGWTCIAGSIQIYPEQNQCRQPIVSTSSCWKMESSCLVCILARFSSDSSAHAGRSRLFDYASRSATTNDRLCPEDYVFRRSKGPLRQYANGPRTQCRVLKNERPPWQGARLTTAPPVQLVCNDPWHGGLSGRVSLCYDPLGMSCSYHPVMKHLVPYPTLRMDRRTKRNTRTSALRSASYKRIL